LLGIKERAHFIDGKVQFSGKPQKGTTVKVTVPIRKNGV
jgi:signal transduction histidine kinase